MTHVVIPEWKRVLRHAWSVRFGVLAVISEGLNAAWPLLDGLLPIDPRLFSVLAGIFAMAAVASRFLYQAEIHRDE